MNSKTLAAAVQAVINANNIAMEGAFLEGSIRLRAEEQEEEDHRQNPKNFSKSFLA
jgi:hypothetical protein